MTDVCDNVALVLLKSEGGEGGGITLLFNRVLRSVGDQLLKDHNNNKFVFS